MTRSEVSQAIARDQLRALAAMQRAAADDLLDTAREAHEAGLSWRDIGEVVGMRHETLFRQVQAGSPVSVLRPFHPARLKSPPNGIRASH